MTKMTNQSGDTKDKSQDEKLVNQKQIKAAIKHCLRISEEIKKMQRHEVVEKLNYYGLSTDGSVVALKKRLRDSYRTFKFSELDIDVKEPRFPYYVVIDFEATCLSKNQPDFPHEIIEFPAILINSKTLEVEDTFQMYCRPVINPKLSDFCVQLTGITQEQVDAAETFKKVLECFEIWLKKHKLLGSKKQFSVVTDTPNDMSRFLYHQCVYSKIIFPKWGEKWINVKAAFFRFYKVKPRNLLKMLAFFDMEFEGRLHCGLDDAKNIARIAIRMIRDGCYMDPMESIYLPYVHRKTPGKILNYKIVDGGDKDCKYNKVETNVRGAFRVISDALFKNSYYRKMKEKDGILLKIENEMLGNCAEEEEEEEEEDLDSPLEWLPREVVTEYRKV